METRVKVEKSGTDTYRAMQGVEKTLAHSSIDKALRELIKVRVSQINGCAFSLDMHWKDARAAGETEQRLYGLPAWRESPYYTPKERAGLLLAEELTRIADRPIPESIFEQVQKQFTDQELGDLIWAIATINTWNRVSIGYGSVPDQYQPASAAH